MDWTHFCSCYSRTAVCCRWTIVEIRWYSTRIVLIFLWWIIKNSCALVRRWIYFWNRVDILLNISWFWRALWSNWGVRIRMDLKMLISTRSLWLCILLRPRCGCIRRRGSTWWSYRYMNDSRRFWHVSTMSSMSVTSMLDSFRSMSSAYEHCFSIGYDEEVMKKTFFCWDAFLYELVFFC